MQASPKEKSHSKLLQLNQTDQLNEYTIILEKCMNSPHKYRMIVRPIEIDQFGDPYVVSQYIENTEEKDRVKLKGKVFGEVIGLLNGLSHYDDLVEDFLEKKILIFWEQDFVTKDKILPFYYKIVLYVKPIHGNIITMSDLTGIKPQTEK